MNPIPNVHNRGRCSVVSFSFAPSLSYHNVLLYSIHPNNMFFLPCTITYRYVILAWGHVSHHNKIRERIEYKMLLLTWKALHGFAPSYIENLISEYTPSRSLRSSGMNLCISSSENKVVFWGPSFHSCCTIFCGTNYQHRFVLYKLWFISSLIWKRSCFQKRTIFSPSQLYKILKILFSLSCSSSFLHHAPRNSFTR